MVTPTVSVYVPRPLLYIHLGNTTRGRGSKMVDKNILKSRSFFFAAIEKNIAEGGCRFATSEGGGVLSPRTGSLVLILFWYHMFLPPGSCHPSGRLHFQRPPPRLAPSSVLPPASLIPVVSHVCLLHFKEISFSDYIFCTFSPFTVMVHMSFPHLSPSSVCFCSIFNHKGIDG